MSTALANAAPRVAPEYYLKSVSGKLKGTVFRLTSKEIFIGRDEKNHIVLDSDPKVSRRHARIVLHKGKYHVQNLTSNNLVYVNNESVKTSLLYKDCILTLGGHSFKFIVVESSQPKALPAEAPQKPQAGLSAINSHDPFGGAPGSGQPTSVLDDKIKIYIAIGVIGLAALYVFTQSKPVLPAKPPSEIETLARAEERISESKTKLEALEKDYASKSGPKSKYKKSHELYIQGFRDFQKSQFASAISSFEVALSINPDNTKARRYLNLSKQRLEELIEYHMAQGRNHKDSNKYDFCISSFKNVMNFLSNKSDPRFKEARVVLKECQLLHRSKFQ